MIDPGVGTGCKIIRLLLLITPFGTSPTECLQLTMVRLWLASGPCAASVFAFRAFPYLNVDTDAVHLSPPRVR